MSEMKKKIESSSSNKKKSYEEEGCVKNYKFPSLKKIHEKFQMIDGRKSENESESESVDVEMKEYYVRNDYIENNVRGINMKKISILVRIKGKEVYSKTMFEKVTKDSVFFKRVNKNYMNKESKKTLKFGFEKVFNVQSNQEEVFREIGDKTLALLLSGINSCVFAYGQTGSGKTFTAVGEKGGLGKYGEHLGLIPRVCNKLIFLVNKFFRNRWHIQLSFLEIYKERTADLLSKKKEYTSHSIYQSPCGEIFIRGVQRYDVENYYQLMYFLDRGMKKRTTRSTCMNETSSRSHAVFVIYFKLASQVNSDEYTTSKLYIVDLAGSEKTGSNFMKKVRDFGMKKERLILSEGISINKSLFHLGRCIETLSKGKKIQRSNFRDSILTWILSDALGGVAKTFMISCISKKFSNSEETLSTLKYSSAAKKIKARVKKNKIQSNSDYSLGTKLELSVNMINELQNKKEMFAETNDKLVLLYSKMEKDKKRLFDVVYLMNKNATNKYGTKIELYERSLEERQIIYMLKSEEDDLKSEIKKQSKLLDSCMYKKQKIEKGFFEVKGELQEIIYQICQYLRDIKLSSWEKQSEDIFENELNKSMKSNSRTSYLCYRILMFLVQTNLNFQLSFINVNEGLMRKEVDTLFSLSTDINTSTDTTDLDSFKDNQIRTNMGNNSSTKSGKLVLKIGL